MRSFALLTILLAMPGTVFAGSFMTIDTPLDNAGSIMTIGGTAPVAKPAAEAPVLAPGHEIIQLKQVDGKMKIYRTSAWLGGSPVTYVTTATPHDIASLQRRGVDVASSKPQPISTETVVASEEPQPTAGSVDSTEMTGAISSEGGKASPGAALDAKDLKLRPVLGRKG